MENPQARIVEVVESKNYNQSYFRAKESGKREWLPLLCAWMNE